MGITHKTGIALGLFSACLLTPLPEVKANLLSDGGFEFGTLFPGWTLDESIYDTTTMMRRDFGLLNTAEQRDFGPQEGELALWLRAFVGGEDPGPNNQTNATLHQDVAITPGETYTLTGWSRYETFYSGGTTTLDPGGPLGAVSTPTTNTFELHFLNSTGAVTGTPATIDVTADRTAQSGAPFFNDWIEHTLSGVAPNDAVSVRVIADASRMVWNGGGSESAFYDSFSLTANSDPSTELLVNGDIETAPPEFDPAWMITEDPGGNFGTPGPVVLTEGFANNPSTGGALGVWFRSFEGDEEDPAGATIAQTVPATPNGEYTFTGWSRFEANYSGGLDGFGTTTELQLEFLDDLGAVIGTPVSLDVRADRESQIGGAANDNMWYEHELMGVAPANAVSVRVIGQASGMRTNPGTSQSFFFDDFSLTLESTPTLPGDFNGDGSVDILDLDILSGNFGTMGGAVLADGDANGDGNVDILDLDILSGNFGSMATQSSAIPEPGAIALLVSGVGIVMLRRRRAA